MEAGAAATYGGSRHGEPRAFWTQGGDSYPGRDNSRDTVVGRDGGTYTSDQATIWRWRAAFQHDFAARMAWTVTRPAAANHNPEVIVNGQTGRGAHSHRRDRRDAHSSSTPPARATPTSDRLAIAGSRTRKPAPASPVTPRVTPGPRPSRRSAAQEASRQRPREDPRAAAARGDRRSRHSRGRQSRRASPESRTSSLRSRTPARPA